MAHTHSQQCTNFVSLCWCGAAGDFQNDVTDDVSELDAEACHGLVGWLDFYQKAGDVRGHPLIAGSPVWFARLWGLVGRGGAAAGTTGCCWGYGKMFRSIQGCSSEGITALHRRGCQGIVVYHGIAAVVLIVSPDGIAMQLQHCNYFEWLCDVLSTLHVGRMLPHVHVFVLMLMLRGVFAHRGWLRVHCLPMLLLLLQTYPRMGRVVGNFYDAAGKSTAAHATVHQKAAEGKKKKVRTAATKSSCVTPAFCIASVHMVCCCGMLGWAVGPGSMGCCWWLPGMWPQPGMARVQVERHCHDLKDDSKASRHLLRVRTVDSRPDSPALNRQLHQVGQVEFGWRVSPLWSLWPDSPLKFRV